MIKNTVWKILAIFFMVTSISGCSFIVADDDVKKYYGIDKNKGDQFLSQILSIQEQLNQAQAEPVRKN